MGENQPKQIGVEVDATLWKQFREDVRRRKGGVRGQLKPELEAALREYLDAADGGDTNDRLTRIEDKVDDLGARLDQIDETKKQSDLSKTVENRLQSIKETIADEADGAPRVHEQVVEMAIKKHAGHSRPTLNQYKDLLQDDHAVYEDPRDDSSYYFRSAPRFCVAVNQMIEDHDIGQDTYTDLVDDEYGREWWGKQVQKFKTDGGTNSPGFE